MVLISLFVAFAENYIDTSNNLVEVTIHSTNIEIVGWHGLLKAQYFMEPTTPLAARFTAGCVSNIAQIVFGQARPFAPRANKAGSRYASCRVIAMAVVT